MLTHLVSLIVTAGLSAGKPFPELPERVEARVEIHTDDVLRDISPYFLGTNLTHLATDKALIGKPEIIERVRSLGLRSVRFPNGCLADLYNWKSPAANEITVDAFLDFCDAIGAEPYYTFNMQGGTEGLVGPPPADAPLEERVKYRHTAPNPCGNTNYYFGTLPEAIELFEKYTVERALAGRTPILVYELGNENWGQAKTDWTPEVYGKNAEIWCRALRERFAAAQREHPQLAGLRLHITAVGFPTMGNNQDPLKAVDHAVNQAWAAEIRKLAEQKLIDAVTDHFYPFPSNIGDGFYWVAHNLHNILALRTGTPNDRLGGYTDPTLAYGLPIEVTEWNIKCWGQNRSRTDLKLANRGFEEGLTAWQVVSGKAAADPAAARRGRAGLKLSPHPDGTVVTQKVSVADRPNALAFGFFVWCRTPSPDALEVSISTDLDGTPAAATQPADSRALAIRRASQKNMWHRLLVLHAAVQHAREIELRIALTGPNAAETFIDEVEPLHTQTAVNMMPVAASRYEQQLFAIDALREMLYWPIPRTHWHHLFGGYPCPQLWADGSMRPNGAVFELVAHRIGRQLVRTTVQTPSFGFDSHADEYATDFSAVTPDLKDIPALAAAATRDDDTVYLLLINRTTDRPITTSIILPGDFALPERIEVRTLTGTDLDVEGARVERGAITREQLARHVIAPLSAQVLCLGTPPVTRPAQ
jgi:alpha-L-arabinofuranosidase